MAFVVVTSLLEIVEQQLLQPNPSSSSTLCDKQMIELLSHKLRFLQAFLEESGKETNDTQAKEMLGTKIRDVVAEAEGKIKCKLREVYLATNRGECIVVACQELYQTLEQTVKDIEPIEARIHTVSHAASSTNDFEEKNIMVGGISQNALETENEIIVGFNKDVDEIVFRLTHPLSSKKREVISLMGEGGIGKTTLAKMIFEHPYIIDYFHIRAWFVVSKEHNLKEMLIGLLHCIVPMTSGISNKNEAQLADQLYRSLMGRRYLIVLDDVWSVAAWDAIQRCFPHNSNGSQIMITTRINEVAIYLRAFPHIMEPQTQEKSWELFSKKVFKERCFCTAELERLGRQILLQCRGLPLAILVMAGLLATAKGSLEIWRDVAETLGGMDSVDDRISRILSLGYDYLPSHLKACFLYFGVFPEDSDIPVKKIINLWVAEGFLKLEKNKSLEEVAENCLFDLINRSLVQVNRLSIDGKIKSCNIHDRLHEICVREAKKESIVCIINEKHVPKASPWISCQSNHWPITRVGYGNHTSNKIHSIFYFGKELYLSKCKLIYPCLKLLRVLDLSLIKYSHNMPSGIADLIYLRYLALNTIGSLYKFCFFKLQNLQTLVVSSWMEEYPLQLPCDILDLPQLRNLLVGKRCTQYLPRLVQGNLQTLYWLKVASSDERPNFRMVPNLKELGIYIEGELVSGCLNGLVHLHLLEKLKFEIGRVERFYLPIGFPPNLKKLTLRYTYLPWKEMDIIGNLPNLEVLKLKDFAFCGPMWKPSERGFQALKVLLIAHSDLKIWDAIAYDFPILERLVLSYCWDLKEVPIAFAYIKTLKLIVLDSCHSSLVTSAYKISSRVTRKFRKIPGHELQVCNLKTQVELPNDESSEEERLIALKKKYVLNNLKNSGENSEKKVTGEFVNFGLDINLSKTSRRHFSGHHETRD